jgi:hypothetical protein
LQVHNYPIPYPLGWVNKDVEIKVMKQCKVKFEVSVYFINEVKLDVVPLDMCGVLFGIPYMHMRDETFMRRVNQYHLIKDGKSFINNAHKFKSNILLVSANQAKNLNSSSKKYVFISLRETQSGDESVRVKASLEVCTKNYKTKLEESSHAYIGVFQETKGLPPKWEVEHEIQLFPHSPLPNNRLNR